MGSKKTIELTILSKEVVKREVEFPIYSKHDLGDRDGEEVYYHRIDEDMLHVTIRYTRSWLSGEVSYSIETTPYFSFGMDGEDYSLGKGIYTCTAREFNRVLADAIAFAELMKVIS